MPSVSQTALVRTALAILLAGVAIFFATQPELLTVYVCLPLALIAVLAAKYFGGLPNAINGGRDNSTLESDPAKSGIFSASPAVAESLLSSCPIAITVTRLRGGEFVDVNAEFARLTDWTREEILGQTMAECGLVTAESISDSLSHPGESGVFSDQEIEIKTRAGETLHVIAGGAVVDIAGERHVINTFANVTEKQRAETMLKASAERLRTVTENARVGLVMIGDDRRFIFVNPAFADILGLPPDSLAGRSVAEIHPELYEKQIAPSLRRVFAGERVKNELRLKMEDGDHFFDVAYDPITVNDLVSSTVAVITDVTERNRTELAREASEERYRTLFEYSPDGIVISNPESYYIDANESICDMLGCSREDVIGSHATQIVVPKEIPHLSATLFGLNEDFEYYREWQLRRHDGSVFPVEVMATKMPDGNTLTVIRDTTDRKHLEDQLLQAQKMEAIGVLAGGVAHDFNNILTAIAGYCDLTLENMPADDQLRSYVVEIKDAGVRAATLTNQLLAFSRKRVLMPSVYNLNLAVTETEKMLRRVVKENIEFRINLDPDLGNVKADPGQIAQVIVNLVINSGDAMPDGGTLTIETRNVRIDHNFAGGNVSVVPGRFVELTISDTGIGMDDETQRRLFEPFFTTKEVGKGTGLGLSTAYGIIRQSGGDITVESEPDHGSTFKIYLPCVDEAVSIPVVSHRNKEQDAGSATILLVEDEAAVRTLVDDVLRKNGYAVLMADSGAAALDICRQYPKEIDLLLTDMVMPGMGGRELKDQVTGIRPGIRVLFMSGYAGDAGLDNIPVLAGSAFIEKPFTPNELVTKVREVLTADAMANETPDETLSSIHVTHAAHGR